MTKTSISASLQKLSEEQKKIVIVVGAGASADFNPKHFIFPVGEALIKNICDKKEIASFFWNEICESFRNVVFEKIKTTAESMINFHNIFCDFLGGKDASKSMINSNSHELIDPFCLYLQNKVELKEQISFCYFGNNNVNRESVLNNLIVLYKDINANDDDLSEKEKNDKKECKFYKIIIANCNSRHLQISRLVNHYQPFSIDELLDSIKMEKIDVFGPLYIEKEDFKQSEEQFRNELINAGKTLIALFLLQSEKRDLFANPNSQNDAKIWYRHIRNLIINSGKDFGEIKEQIQNLTIISFNYDRSLDYYLRTRLSDYYDEIKERVFYPYGKLAVDNWDCDDYGKYNKGGKFNPYNDDELREIEDLGQGLRVIGELDDNFDKELKIPDKFDEETKIKLTKFNDLKKEVTGFPNLISRKFYFKQVEKVLKEDFIKELEEINDYLKKKKELERHQKDCEFLLDRVKAILSLSLKDSKIYFLGFAFHQANCNFLALNQLSKFSVEKKIYYTNFDESESINNMVKDIFYIPSDRIITIHESKRKGVYDALMHDFKLGF